MCVYIYIYIYTHMYVLIYDKIECERLIDAEVSRGAKRRVEGSEGFSAPQAQVK